MTPRRRQVRADRSGPGRGLAVLARHRELWHRATPAIVRPARWVCGEGPITPLRAFNHIAAITLASFAWTLGLPGGIAYHNGVFYEEQMKDRLPEPIRKQLEEFRSRQEQLKEDLRQIDAFVTKAPKDAPQMDKQAAALERRAQLERELKTASPPVVLYAFFPDLTWIMSWPTRYIFLGCLVILLSPVVATPGHAARQPLLCLWDALRQRKTWWIAGILYVGYEWPLWVRNFVLNQKGRKVYACQNFDIDPGSFFAQEFMIFGFALLLAVIFVQFSEYFLRLRTERAAWAANDPVATALDPGYLSRLSEVYVHWQVSSIVLAVPFLTVTGIFWHFVVRSGDERYLISAALSQALWAGTWIMISLPLAYSLHTWNSVRNQAIAAVTTGADGRPAADRDVTVRVLRETSPISYWSTTASGATVFVSFLLPVVQAYWK